MATSEKKKMTVEDIKNKTFLQITKEDMFKFVEDNYPDKMAEFMRASHFVYESRTVLDDDGKAVMTEPKISKVTGKPTKPRIKKQRIAFPYGSEEYIKAKENGKEPSFDTVRARYFFCKQWFPELIPTKKDTNNKKNNYYEQKYAQYL